ncbi:APC family permease [Alphaproteobacteria bacterium endosymbiont of Tiliacea citrago]|uniref:APC family permease n=1 Tax=Alphaproteobacteria bacterium endosymbiont of Tiliacea citrago TaxID=3077944 RepID=UPI00313E9F84
MENDKVQVTSSKMGLWAATALVFSGMVGSGILFLPYKMASCGSWGIFSWIMGAIMTYCMFLSFAGVNNYYLKNMSNKNPDIMDFLKLKYCDRNAFLLAFGHFFAMAICASVTALALGNYFLGLFPGSILCAKSIASLSLLLMFFINLISFGAANALNFWLTLAKLLFFLLIAILGVGYASSYKPVFGSPTLLFSGAATTMFAFMGIEFGIFASGSIENPEENVIKATKYGLISASLIFIGVYLAALFIIPDLSLTKTPIYDCSIVLFGKIGAKIIAVVAILSCLTGLNGNLVVQGNSLRNFSKKKHIVNCFDVETSQGFPWRGALTSLTISILIIWFSSLDLEVFAVTFIGVLYTSVVVLDILLNGLAPQSLLAIVSSAIMLCNSFTLPVIIGSAFIYLVGYCIKFFSCKECKKEKI